LAAEQDGRPGEAVERGQSLIAHAPADAPWVTYVREALARVEPARPPAPPSGTPAVAGPTVRDVASAADMSSTEREQMVRGMVERLAPRLAAPGSDVDAWPRPLRAH